MRLCWQAFNNINAVKTTRSISYRVLPHYRTFLPLESLFRQVVSSPELFDDLDLRHTSEYIDNFSQSDYNVSEHGVFAYPPM
jgi:hypothetical protein